MKNQKQRYKEYKRERNHRIIFAGIIYLAVIGIMLCFTLPTYIGHIMEKGESYGEVYDFEFNVIPRDEDFLPDWFNPIMAPIKTVVFKITFPIINGSIRASNYINDYLEQRELI